MGTLLDDECSLLLQAQRYVGEEVRIANLDLPHRLIRFKSLLSLVKSLSDTLRTRYVFLLSLWLRIWSALRRFLILFVAFDRRDCSPSKPR